MAQGLPRRQQPHFRQCAASIAAASRCADTYSDEGSTSATTFGVTIPRILPTPRFLHHSAPLRSLCDVNKASISKLSARMDGPQLQTRDPLNLKRTLPLKAIQRLEVAPKPPPPVSHDAVSA